MGVIGRPIVAAQLHGWRLSQRPERFTELFFTDVAQVSATASSPHLINHIPTFTIHNLEHQSTKYHYEIAAIPSDTGVAQPLGGGEATLAHNQSQTFEQTIAIPEFMVRTMVKISLEYEGISFGQNAPSPQGQSLHYWIESNGSGSEGA